MAEQKEIFHVLRDPNGDGIAPDARSATESLGLSIVNVPVIGSKDSSGNGQYAEVRTEGQNADSVNWGVQLAAKDEFGNLQFMPMNNGAIVVTSDGAGTKLGARGDGTVSTAGVAETAATLSISLNKAYDNVEITVSSFKDCTWELQYGDDVGGGGETYTTVDKFRTGAGQYTFQGILDNYRLDTSSGTGTQEFRLRVTQRAGSGSDYSASIRVIEGTA